MGLMDFMDDFVFGPMNLIANLVEVSASAARTSKSKRRHAYSAQETVRVSIPRTDKGGKVHVLDVVDHLIEYGVDVIGGRHAIKHDSQRFTVVVPKRQVRWVQWLYNNGELRSPQSRWKR